MTKKLQREIQEILKEGRSKKKPRLLRQLEPELASPQPEKLPELPLPSVLAGQVKRLPIGRKLGHLSVEAKGAASGKDPLSVVCPECRNTLEVTGPFPKTVTCPECGWTGEVRT